MRFLQLIKNISKFDLSDGEKIKLINYISNIGLEIPKNYIKLKFREVLNDHD